jgi:SAM-dependent methyltransferase
LLANVYLTLTELPKGLDFARNVYPYSVGSENVWYERTHPAHIKKIFSYFKERARPVIDLGCGKGYMIYRLKQMGFFHVDGVEYDEEIYQIACQNMEMLNLEKEVTIYHMDARDFDDFDQYGILYLFHPFKGSIMREVIRNVEKSLARKPRRFTVVYFYPIEHRMWEMSPYFEREKVMLLEYSNINMEVCYYEHDPARKIVPRIDFSKVLQNALDKADSINVDADGLDVGTGQQEQLDIEI